VETKNFIIFSFAKPYANLSYNNVFVVTTTSNMTTPWNPDEITLESKKLNEHLSKNWEI
jgi:hypothetical protein